MIKICNSFFLSAWLRTSNSLLLTEIIMWSSSFLEQGCLLNPHITIIIMMLMLKLKDTWQVLQSPIWKMMMTGVKLPPSQFLLFSLWPYCNKIMRFSWCFQQQSSLGLLLAKKEQVKILNFTYSVINIKAVVITMHIM